MQVPRTKKTPKELPEYFVPKVPYPAWDADWDGRRRARWGRGERADRDDAGRIGAARRWRRRWRWV